MKRNICFAMVLMLLILGGCSGNDPASVASSKDNGSSSSEIPQQIRQQLDQADFDESNIGDKIEMAYSFDWPPDYNDTSYDVYAVTYLWGTFVPSTDQAADPTDWTGMLSMNAEGNIGVLSTIDFEPGQDAIIPTDAPTTVAWKSITLQDLDGISILVFFKRGNEYFVAPELTFKTSPVTFGIPIGQLDDYLDFFMVDQNNGVAVHAHKVKRHICPGGEFTGEWVRVRNGLDSGYFKARMTNQNGRHVGDMLGEFWQDEGDYHYDLQGVVIYPDSDIVIAKLLGRWFYDDPRLCPMCGAAHGQFEGKIIYGDGVTGKFIGEFGDYALPPEQLNMPMHGRWHLSCVDIAVDNLSADK